MPTITDKYTNLVDRGHLPLMFKKMTFQDPEKNHELQPQPSFYSPQFNTRALRYRFTERTLFPI